MKFYLILFLASICFVSDIFADDDWKRVYLATFPRSGNHWMRYLIEEATHIATSSVYADNPTHLKTLFPWGAYSTNHGYDGTCRYPEKEDFVVIKTHYPLSLHPFLNPIKFIRIVRHPIDSFYSYIVYNNGGIPQLQIKDEDVKIFINYWRKFQTYWNNEANVFTIRYEDLLLSPKEVLKETLDQIGYQVSEEDIERAIDKYFPQGYELKHLSFFSQKQLNLIRTELKDLMDLFNYNIPD